MSPLELRLRERIDALLDDRDQLARALSAARVLSRARRHCVYCGHLTRTGATVPACIAHADLVALDPNYTDARLAA